MDHEGARRLMAEAIEGKLAPDDERELAMHLVGCSECKTIYEGLLHVHPALGAIAIGNPPTEAVDAAVHRATTVLRGEADPGPLRRDDDVVRIATGSAPTSTVQPTHVFEIPAAPPLPAIDETLPALEESEEIVPAGPATPTGPLPHPASPAAPVLPTEEPSPPEQPQADDVRSTTDEPKRAPAPIEPDETVEPVREPLVVPAELPQFERAEHDVPSEDPAPVGATDEIERLLEEDRQRYLYGDDEEQDGERMGPGPWLIAIAVTVVLAVLAGILITRGQGVFGGRGGGNLPQPGDLKSHVGRAFIDMKSLKTSFTIDRLGLYRMGNQQGSLVYSFSNGRYAGRTVYDRAEGYRQDFSLTVRSSELSRAKVVQTADETRSLIGSGTDQKLLVEKRPPLGPPDGQFRPALGLLEDALGSAVRLIANAKDLQVVRKETRNGADQYDVRFTVHPTELTRADRVEAAIDARTYIPVIVKRSISRSNARVLGPQEALSNTALDTAFGNNTRVTTELVQLDNVIVDDIVLPGDFVLDSPSGIKTQTSDAGFERVQRADAASKLPFKPLFPRTLPANAEERTLAVFTGKQHAWGPGNSLPAPKGVFHASYFDGTTTIVVTERGFDKDFNINGSPLAGTGLPVTVTPVTSADKTFYYGTSPETPPHVYGFLGSVFVMVSGYAPQQQLVNMIASLAEPTPEVPAPAGASPSPGASASPSSSGVLPGN